MLAAHVFLVAERSCAQRHSVLGTDRLSLSAADLIWIVG